MRTIHEILILYTKFTNTFFSSRFDHCSLNKTKDPRKNNHKILIADSDIHNYVTFKYNEILNKVIK